MVDDSAVSTSLIRADIKSPILAFSVVDEAWKGKGVSSVEHHPCNFPFGGSAPDPPAKLDEADR